MKTLKVKFVGTSKEFKIYLIKQRLNFKYGSEGLNENK